MPCTLELPHRKNVPEEISIKFWVRTTRTPYYLEKKLTMKGEDPTLYIDELIVNEGYSECQFMWGHHPAFGPIFLDESCVIEVPDGCKIKTDNTDLGKYGVLPKNTEFNWPKVEGTDGVVYDLSKVPPPDSKLFFMYYFYNITEGWYRITNTKKK